METAPADLFSIGERCSVTSCSQRDFLPFQCNCCNRVFCLEHRSFQAHACPASSKLDSTAVVCPLCAKGVKLEAGADPNAVFQQHLDLDCDPANYNKVHKKPKCPAVGCRERLVTTNTYACKKCGRNVCLKHRFASDHQCSGWPEPARPRSGTLGLGFLEGLTGASTSAQSKGEVARRRPPEDRRGLQAILRGAASSCQDAQPMEECPHCNASFGSIQSLINHVESRHQQSCQQQAMSAQCPQCGKAFPDAPSVVRHVEVDHSSHSACILS